MSNIQFCHKRVYKFKAKLTGLAKELSAKGGVTMALDVTGLKSNLQIMKVGDTLVMDVGIAICSDLDNYDKKLGRTIAAGRLKPRELLVTAINDVYIALVNSEITFTILTSGEKLRFVSVE